MSKKHTSLNIEENVLIEAKKRGYNLSEIAEKALKTHMNIKDVEIDTKVEECEFCDRKMRQATADDLNGLTWLYPDERWICPRCLTKMSRKETWG